MLNSRQRAQLRGLANSLDTIFQIGKGGVTENTVKQVNDALEARELVKISVLDNSDTDPREAAEQIAELTSSEVVTVIGRKIILFKVASKPEKRSVSALI